MSNRPYKNIKRFVDTLSREVKKTMEEAKDESTELTEDPKTEEPKVTD